MPLIDAQGRIFGRVNVFDALVVVFVCVFVPVGYAAYRVFRIPPPIITSVEPAVVPSGPERHIRMVGEHFIPYLRVFFWKTGEPLSVVGRISANTQGRFLLESPTQVEIQIPPELPAGTYDLYLFNETEEVAHRQAAFTIAPPQIEDGVFDVRVRFVVAPEIVPLIQVDQIDSSVGLPVPQTGRIMALEVLDEPASQLEMTLSQDEPRYFGAVSRAKIVLALLRVEAREVDGVLRYQTGRLRAGERLRFQTREYLIRGTVLGVTKIVDASELLATAS